MIALETLPNRAQGENRHGNGQLPLPVQEVRQNRNRVDPIPPPKWELPSFEGHEPKVWIRTCERYFSLYRTQDN